jgi:hypothetical protein
VRFVSLKEGEELESLERSPDQQQQRDNGAMEGLRLPLALARLELEQQDDGAMEGLRVQLALARLELELSQSAREQAASDLSLTR